MQPPSSVDPDPLALLAAAEHAYAHHDLVAGCAAAGQAWAALEPCGGEARGQRARAGFLLAHCLYRLGRLRELLAHSEAAVAAQVEVGDDESACQVLRWTALVGAETGAFEEAIAAARAGLERAHRAGLNALHVLLTCALASSFERMGDPWQADRLLREALVEAQADGGDLPRFVTFNNLTSVALTAFFLLREGGALEEAGQVLVRARGEATQGLRLAERIGDPFYRYYIEGNLGDVLVLLGEHDEGEQHLQRALTLAQCMGSTALALRVECKLGELVLERGQAERARDLLVPLVRSMVDSTPEATVRRTHHALYRAWREIGDTESALRSLEVCQRLDRGRVLIQLRAQAQNLVSRAEIERAYRDARFHRERASALVEVAAQDRLTGLTSRWGLEQQLIERGSQDGRPLAVALLDLDNFKPVNDRLGHAAGDAALVKVAAVLRSELRQNDVVARLGGDEFAVMLPGAGRDRAMAILQRLRAAVEGVGIQADEATPLRLSIGMAMIGTAGDPRQPIGEWLAPADAALYESKRLGGNRLTVAVS
jgi:diguanylate cyclase (GGDEF)-like protein